MEPENKIKFSGDGKYVEIDGKIYKSVDRDWEMLTTEPENKEEWEEKLKDFISKWTYEEHGKRYIGIKGEKSVRYEGFLIDLSSLLLRTKEEGIDKYIQGHKDGRKEAIVEFKDMNQIKEDTKREIEEMIEGMLKEIPRYKEGDKNYGLWLTSEGYNSALSDLLAKLKEV